MAYQFLKIRVQSISSSKPTELARTYGVSYELQRLQYDKNKKSVPSVQLCLKGEGQPILRRVLEKGLAAFEIIGVNS